MPTSLELLASLLLLLLVFLLSQPSLLVHKNASFATFDLVLQLLVSLLLLTYH
jgi:hypothetical protein